MKKKDSSDKRTSIQNKLEKETSKDEKKQLSQKQKNKKNTSLRLEKQTLNALKIAAIEQDTSIQKLIESLIEDYLSKHNQKSK